jgi:hypothetical protein
MKNDKQIKLQLRFPPISPNYVNAVVALPISKNLVQIDLGFIDLGNLVDVHPQENFQNDFIAQPNSIARVVLDSERAQELIEMLKQALEIQLDTDGRN